MSLRVTSLGTGSSGNAILVEADETVVLVDCGLPTRTIERYLRQDGIDPNRLTGVLLTHEHGDHSASAGVTARRYGVPIIANRRTLAAARDIIGSVPTRPITTGNTQSVGNLEVTAFPVPHDAAEPVGFLLEHADAAVCIILDAGRPSEEMRVPLRRADLIVIEANHDRERLLLGPYPPSMKARILSDIGHLSNADAGDLLVEAAGSGKRQWAWLAHLSEVNNSPTLALRHVQATLQRAAVSTMSVQISHRDRPSVRWQFDTVAWQEGLF